MSSADRLIIILNDEQQPPKEFTSRNLLFDVPVVDTPPEEQTGKWNTKLTLEGVPGRGYYGPADIYYRRVPMSDLGAVEIRSTSGFTDEQIVSMINNMLGASIDPSELEPIDIPDIALDESKVITITAKPESLGWYGSTTMTLTYGRPYFNSIIADRLLSVLTHGIANVNGLPYAKDLSYEFDFTSMRDAFAKNPSGFMTDPATLIAKTIELGFPGWNAGRVRDYPTSQITDANKNFDRVAIVDLNSGGMIGPIYLHYKLFDE
jgi:hypothetical protein